LISGGVRISGGYLGIIAGPYTIESREQAFTIARAVRAAGACLFRGGAYKPDEALSDGNQFILPSQFEQLMSEIRQIAPILGRRIAEAAREGEEPK
jgi:3-deoxy-D-arabino-heptulosonate 7-phosphate (DAHP) synthase